MRQTKKEYSNLMLGNVHQRAQRIPERSSIICFVCQSPAEYPRLSNKKMGAIAKMYLMMKELTMVPTQV